MEAIFFPRNDYPNNVEVCAHRLGKKMTYTEQTTVPHWWSTKYLLPYALELGIKTGWAPNPRYTNVMPIEEYKALDRQELIYNDYYFYTPDYSPEYVLDLFLNTAQPWFIENFRRKPTVLIFSQGNTSYADTVTPYLLGGKNNLYNHQSHYGLGCGNPDNIPYNHYDYMRYTGSFRVQSESGFEVNNGWSRIAYDSSKPMYNRNTTYQIGDICNMSEDYMYSYIATEQIQNVPPTYSVYPNMPDIDNVISKVSDLIDYTMGLPNGGWLFNFSHWHDVVENDIDIRTDTPREGHEDLPTINQYKRYLSMLASKNANNEIYFAGYGEAVAYLVYRQIITKVAMYSPIQKADTLIIQLETKNNLGIDTDLLQVPISVKFSTVGTPLENVEIESESNLINFGNNEYIIEISYNEYPRGIITKKYL